MGNDDFQRFLVDQFNLIDLGEKKSRLVMAIHIPENELISFLASPSTRTMIETEICYAIGYFASWLKEFGLSLCETEIMLSHKGAYLDLANSLTTFFAEKNISVKVFYGISVHVPDYDLNGNKTKIDLQLKNFTGTMFTNN